MSDPITAIKLILKYITADDIDKINKILNVMPIQQLSRIDSDNLFNTFITQCFRYNKLKSAKTIFEAWNIYLIGQSQNVSNYTNMYRNPRYSIDLLSFCAKVFPKYIFVEGIDELIESNDTEVTYYACNRMQNIYGIQTANTYKSLLDIADTRNLTVAQFCIDQLRVVSDYSQIPPYMILLNDDSIISYVKSVDDSPIVLIPGYSVNDIAYLLLKNMEDLGIIIDDIEKAKSLLIIKLMASSIQELVELIAPINIKINITENIDIIHEYDLFRTLGPSNPYYDLSTEELKHGGGRMFERSIYDYDSEHEDNDERQEWFEGFCWECNNRIRRRWHAIRRPIKYGGWKGCYCTWDCLHDSIDKSNYSELENHILSDLFREQIDEIGIYDRDKGIGGENKEDRNKETEEDKNKNEKKLEKNIY